MEQVVSNASDLRSDTTSTSTTTNTATATVTYYTALCILVSSSPEKKWNENSIVDKFTKDVQSNCSCSTDPRNIVIDTQYATTVDEVCSYLPKTNQPEQVMSLLLSSSSSSSNNIEDTTTTEQQQNQSFVVRLIVMSPNNNNNTFDTKNTNDCDDNDNNNNNNALSNLRTLREMFRIASHKYPQVLRVVYYCHDTEGTESTAAAAAAAGEAQSEESITEALEAGKYLSVHRADVVADSYATLHQAIEIFFFPNNEIHHRTGTDVDSKAVASNAANTNTSTTKSMLFPLSVKQIQDREKSLRILSKGITTYRIQQLHTWSTSLSRQCESIENILAVGQPNNEDSSTVRIVHVSDTHNQHRWITQNLPQGDVFIHTGDICGNYTKDDILIQHFEDFLNWLHNDICPKFDKVLFIGGNHDVYLDQNDNRPGYENDVRSIEKAQQMLVQFLQQNPNASYIHDTVTTYKGVRIYGLAAIPCRLELEDKWYISNGFESNKVERIELWDTHYPKDIDILVTHCPPDNIGVSTGVDGCPIMTEYVYGTNAKSIPPSVHLFGHIHGLFGIAHYSSTNNNPNDENASKTSSLGTKGTILMNGCQACILKIDPCCGGLPLVLDLPIPQKPE